jgi:hypothetical protein
LARVCQRGPQSLHQYFIGRVMPSRSKAAMDFRQARSKFKRLTKASKRLINIAGSAPI